MSDPKKNPLHTMTPEDFIRFAKSKGIDAGQWQDIGDREFEPSFVAVQKNLMGSLKSALEASIEADRDEIGRLKQRLAKLQFGGGES